MWDAVQRSLMVQASVSVHWLSAVQQLGMGVCWHPVALLQLSAVHALPSSQTSGVPETQLPPAHVSIPSHAAVSAQLVPSRTAVCRHPVAGWQLSSVQGWPSSQFTGLD